MLKAAECFSNRLIVGTPQPLSIWEYDNSGRLQKRFNMLILF